MSGIDKKMEAAADLMKDQLYLELLQRGLPSGEADDIVTVASLRAKETLTRLLTGNNYVLQSSKEYRAALALAARYQQQLEQISDEQEAEHQRVLHSSIREFMSERQQRWRDMVAEYETKHPEVTLT